MTGSRMVGHALIKGKRRGAKYVVCTMIQGFTRSLCREVGKYGITVNCVAPGSVKTAMTESIPKEIIEAGIKQIPVKRIGTPEDMGYAYLFLSSKEAGFISGITLHANGGMYPI